MEQTGRQIVLFCLLLFPQTVTALEQPKINLDLDIPFQHFSHEDGLPAGPTCISQDHLGYLWFGTVAGLYRYDGHEFKLFFPRAGLHPDSVSRPQGICEDKFGNILYAQRNIGIFRLDRNSGRFTHFFHDPRDLTTLSTNNIGGFYLDSHGFLWIAAISEVWADTVYLDRLDTRSGRVKRFRYNAGEPNSITSDNVLFGGIGFWNPLVIVEDSNSDVWIGLKNSGVVRYNRRKDNFTRFTHSHTDAASLSSDRIVALAPDRNGIVWVSTLNGLNRFDPITESFVRFRHDPGNRNSVGSDACFAVFPERSGRLWISHGKGLDRYDPDTGSFEHFRHNPDDPRTPSRADRILPVYEDDDGAVWFLTKGDFCAVNLYDPNTRSFQRFENSPANPEGFQATNFFSFYADRSHTLWIGSNDGILNKIYANTNRFYKLRESGHLANSLPSGNVRNILASRRQEGIIWIATSGGLSRLDWRLGTFKHFQHDPRNSNSLCYNDLNCISEDDRGNLWLSTKEGLDKLEASGTFTHFLYVPADSTTLSENSILNTQFDPGGRLWICTDSTGINSLDIQSGRVKRYSRKIYDPNSINVGMQAFFTYIDRSGTAWIGGDSGLNRLDHQTGFFSHFLEGIVIRRMHEDRWGGFWVGTYGRGFFKFDRQTGQRQILQKGHPLFNGDIRDIVEDEDGFLWISTNHGLVRFDPRDNSCLPLSSQHGLPETRFLTCGAKLKNGWMLWGTSSKGLILFDPKSIRQNLYPPQAVITELRISDRPLPVGGDSPLKCDISLATELDLRHDQNDISFVCAALHFVRPVKNQYAFRLENYDSGWREAGTNRVATYTNLDPGRYVFQVKACNSEGVWNEQPASLKLHIHPPWYAAWWAYGFYLIILTGAVFTLWTGQTRRIRLRDELKYKKLETEKLQEIDGIKTRFLANISHEFRTPLTLISGPIEQLLKKVKDSELSEEIKIMQRNADRLGRLVNQLLDLSKIEAGKMTLKTRRDDIVSFINRIVQSFESRARLKHIDLTFHSPHSALEAYIDHEKLENVMYNLIANAVKFTPEHGRIGVTVEKKKTLVPPPAPPSRKPLMDGEVVIAVRDSGPGIPEAYLDKIFDRFYRIEENGESPEAGTGIGLALAKELVDLHHGRLTVASRMGEGSVFSVTLPTGRGHLTDQEIVEPSAFPSTSPAEADPQPVMGAIQGSRDRKAPALLIVEDNADLRYYIHTILKSHYRIFESESGLKGMEIALKEIPDLILSDVMMPGMNGFELCEKIKTDARTSHIPVVLLTARADMDSKIHGLETGADDYLVKPFNETELKARVNNLIEQRRKLRERFGRDILAPMKEVAVTSADERFLQKAVDFIERHLGDGEFALSSLCEHMGLSRSQLHRKLKAIVNMSTTEFIRSIRLRRAAELLKKRFGNIAEIAYEVGFNNPAYFSDCFRKQFGVLPSEYKPE